MAGKIDGHTSVTGTTSSTLPGVGGLDLIKQREQREMEKLRSKDEGENSRKKSRKERKAEEKEAKRLRGDFKNYPHLDAIRPKEGYFFRSDYFEVDGDYAAVLGFFHSETSRDDFAAFWGVSRIPGGLGEGVSVTVLEQVRRWGEKQVNDKIMSSERLARLDETEADTRASRRKVEKTSVDLEDIIAEIQDGAGYLHVHNRLLVKAPTLDGLDEAIEKISRLYVDRLGTVTVAPYPGEQRKELASLFAKNEHKRGKGFGFTTTEYAGSYHLVTNGLNDAGGEYVGYMIGDVNNSAVIFDVDDWERRVVLADSTQERRLNRAHYPDMWGSKISQAALLRNRKVVHLILDGANMDILGPKFERITARLDMSQGDLNMFELFGDYDEELSVFPSHLDKVVLMAEQAYETTDADRSIIRGSLRETLTQFYIDQGMWYRNAKENRHRLRIVGIPHEQVPRLQDIVTYFDTQYQSLSRSQARDEELLHAYAVLRLVFRDLLDNNGDLFNTHTNPAIDFVSGASRVLYDFSQLMRRGKGVAMAQLVNVIGFAVGQLGLGDVVIIHGTEYIDEGIKGYINEQLTHLYARGGRVAYLYNDVDLMLKDMDFNKFDSADWTIFGPMREPTVIEYQKKMAQDVPPDLESLITSRGEKISYLRRGHTNVVFHTDLALGVNPAREERRKKAEEKSRAMMLAEQAAAKQAQGVTPVEPVEKLDVGRRSQVKGLGRRVKSRKLRTNTPRSLRIKG